MAAALFLTLWNVLTLSSCEATFYAGHALGVQCFALLPGISLERTILLGAE
jgi:hypothetical protein